MRAAPNTVIKKVKVVPKMVVARGLKESIIDLYGGS